MLAEKAGAKSSVLACVQTIVSVIILPQTFLGAETYENTEMEIVR